MRWLLINFFKQTTLGTRGLHETQNYLSVCKTEINFLTDKRIRLYFRNELFFCPNIFLRLQKFGLGWIICSHFSETHCFIDRIPGNSHVTRAERAFDDVRDLVSNRKISAIRRRYLYWPGALRSPGPARASYNHNETGTRLPIKMRKKKKIKIQNARNRFLRRTDATRALRIVRGPALAPREVTYKLQ